MNFYDVHEQTKYKVTVSRPETVEELSDLFMTEEELQDLVGRNFYCSASKTPRTFLLNSVIEKELQGWAEKLEESGKKTLPIDDDELLDVLRGQSYVSDFIDSKYGRHGDRICFSRRYERRKTRPTKGDVRVMWDVFQYAFHSKFGCWPPHIPIYNRHVTMFAAFQKILGWKLCHERMKVSGYAPAQIKFFRQIWDKPEEYV